MKNWKKRPKEWRTLACRSTIKDEDGDGDAYPDLGEWFLHSFIFLFHPFSVSFVFFLPPRHEATAAMRKLRTTDGPAFSFAENASIANIPVPRVVERPFSERNK